MVFDCGIIDQMWAAPEISTEDYLRQTIADVQLCDELGFDSFWFGEHHFLKDGTFYGRIPVPELLIARLANETRRIRLGTGVKILPLESPLRFAETVSLLDLLTDGRAVFGVGQGSGLNIDFTGIDETTKHRIYIERFAEALRYLHGDTSGGLYRLSPTPRRSLADLLWVASRDEAAIDFAAANGLNFVVGQAEIAVTQADYVARYRARGGSGEARGCRLVFVGATDSEALAEVERAAATYGGMMLKGNYHRLAVERGLFPATPPVDLRDLLYRVDYIVGDPERVAGELLRYVRVTGVDRIDVMMHIPHITPDAMRRSMTLFAQEVAPRLRAALPEARARQAAS